MADKVTKTVEIELTTNDSKLKSGVTDANKTLSDLKSTQAKGNKQADREQGKRDRDDKFRKKSQQKSDKSQAQARQRDLQILRKIETAETRRLSAMKKQTTELEKQARLHKAIGGPPGGGPPPGGGGGGGGGGKGPAGGATGSVGTLLKSLATKIVLGTFGVITGVLASQVRAGYQTFVEGEKAQAPLAAATLDRPGFRQAAKVGYEQYGYVRAETARQALDMARETGNVRDVSFAQMVSRSGAGVGLGGSTDLMGLLTRSGQKGFEQTNSKGKREFENVIARGMDAGLTKNEAIGRMPEFISGITRLVQRQGAVAAGDVTAMSAAKLLSFFGKSDKTGFQGARGAEVISKLDAAVRKPGGGEEGEALMMRAFGFGTPGGTAGFMEARERMQQGITGTGGVQNLIDMVTQAQREFGGGEGTIFALEKVTGLSISQIKGVMERVDALKAGGDASKIKKDIEKFAAGAPTIKSKEAAADTAGFAKTVKKLSTLTQHLDNIGGKVFTPIHSIQEGINKMVNEEMPVVVGFLEIAAKAATKSSDTLVDIRNMGADFAGRPGGPLGRTRRGIGGKPTSTRLTAPTAPPLPPGVGDVLDILGIPDLPIPSRDKEAQTMHRQILLERKRKAKALAEREATRPQNQPFGGIIIDTAPLTGAAQQMVDEHKKTEAGARASHAKIDASFNSFGIQAHDINYTPGTPQ